MNNDKPAPLAIADATGNGGPIGKRGRVPGSGRPKGGINKVTREFREVVRDLLESNAGNMSLWLASVAEGDPGAGRAPDPAKALDLLARLAEFACPKLGRIEHTAPTGAPLVTSIEIEFVNAPPRLVDERLIESGRVH